MEICVGAVEIFVQRVKAFSEGSPCDPLSFAFSVSEYADFDNIFAPREKKKQQWVAILDLSGSCHLNFNGSKVGEADSVKYDA